MVRARFRLAQIRLKRIQATRKPKSLLITSPLPGDGKSTGNRIIGIILKGVEGLDRTYSKYYGYGRSETRSKSTKPKTFDRLGMNKHAK